MTLLAADQFDFATVLREGDVIAWPQGPAEPLSLTRRLLDQLPSLPSFRLFVGMTTSPSLASFALTRTPITALNGAGSNRKPASAGRLDILPAHVSAVPRLLRSGAIRVDLVLLRAKPAPDGRLSLGVIADYTAALIEAARCVIVEIDERLPLTGDDASFASELVDIRVAASDMAQIELPDPTPREQEVLVARRVADLVPDGATVQVGIGGLPVAVLAALRGHRGLQIHSGVVPDAVVGLVEAGAVTGRLVTGGLFGSQRLFEFADGNPDVCMRSAEFTHSGAEMARIDSFHTVNSAIEVDLTGQVNSEVAAGRYLGAVGGQVDFVRGAQLSPGGRSIIALPAATEDGGTSRIVAELAGPVTTARSDVDFVVTDFGTADLRGSSLAERAERLASIAHPSFRETLLAEAHAMRVAEI